MTPLPNSITEGEKLYNKAHKSGRNAIERCNGVLKTRFRCLLKENIRSYSPEKYGLIINAWAVLHNILTKHRIPVTDEIINLDDVVEPDTRDTRHYNDETILLDGLRERDALILNNFS